MREVAVYLPLAISALKRLNIEVNVASSLFLGGPIILQRKLS